ncbi:MAG: AI-2E family transporter [Gordonia sp. (in: high G+C Gram-positive bacteria)]|uniref:AI-2E family transporter n=1 Tax=Gordonia sp. (in: high G+C Gram-positive bacteria) TaxID=84139 RepID=UPI003BB7EF1F
MPRGLIVVLGMAGLVVSVAGLRSVADIVGPVFLALMLVVAVHPISRWLRARGWPAWVASLTVILAVYAILLALFASVAFSLVRLTSILPQYSDQFDKIVHNLEQTLSKHGVTSESFHNAISHVDASKVVDAVGGVVGQLTSLTSTLVLVIVLVLFMAADSIGFTDRMTALHDARPDIASALNSFALGTRKYLVVTTVFGFIVAVLDAGFLWWVGIPLPILWGVLSFITNYIPNIGFILGLVPPAMLALLGGGVSKMVLVIVVYSAINIVLQSIVQPKFVGDAVGLSATLTFLSLLVWAFILGPLGAILAVPLTILSKALLVDIDPATRWADVLLTGGSAAQDTEAAMEAAQPPDGR